VPAGNSGVAVGALIAGVETALVGGTLGATVSAAVGDGAMVVWLVGVAAAVAVAKVGAIGALVDVAARGVLVGGVVAVGAGVSVAGTEVLAGWVAVAERVAVAVDVLVGCVWPGVTARGSEGYIASEPLRSRATKV
jgi:hypothetical protein